MLKSKGIINHTLNEFRISRKYCSYNSRNGAHKLRRVLIVTKLSRYEFEQIRYPHLNKVQLEDAIKKRGTDYDNLLYLHNVHKEFEMRIRESFENVGFEVKVTNRASANKDVMEWADILVPVGGDGTFLLAAGRASPLSSDKGPQKKTPIVGFNSDPNNSEGRLMLPKYYSEHPEDAIAKIKSGDFRLMNRSRIRTTLLGNNGHMPEPVDLHRHIVTKIEQEKIDSESLSEELSEKYKANMKRVLPYLALNEVFIGETLSARVSHLHLIIDHSNVINKTKSSGLCVSTGSGSTSWHASINRLSECTVNDLIQLLSKTNGGLDKVNVKDITDIYNNSLRFPPDDSRFCYSIREQICVGIWPQPKNFPCRNFIKNLFVRSQCIDACLVIDGSISYPFNSGAKALLEVYPEDALLTISLD